MTTRRFAEGLLLLAMLAAANACDSSDEPDVSDPRPTASPSGGTERPSVQPPPSQDKKGPPPPAMRLALADGDPNVVATPGATLLLTTFGSSSCPHRIEDVQKASANRIRIVLSDGSGRRLCTADVAPHHEQVVLPQGMATHDVKRAVIFVRVWLNGATRCGRQDRALARPTHSCAAATGAADSVRCGSPVM